MYNRPIEHNPSSTCWLPEGFDRKRKWTIPTLFSSVWIMKLAKLDPTWPVYTLPYWKERQMIYKDSGQGAFLFMEYHIRT